MKGCRLLALLVLGTPSHASEPSWQVLPDTCVVEKSGDFCDMSLKIMTSGLPEGTYCLHLSDRQLDCWNAATMTLNTVIQYRQSGRLDLLDSTKHVVLSKELKIKALQPAQTRRRIRSPWSIF